MSFNTRLSDAHHHRGRGFGGPRARSSSARTTFDTIGRATTEDRQPNESINKRRASNPPIIRTTRPPRMAHHGQLRQRAPRGAPTALGMYPPSSLQSNPQPIGPSNWQINAGIPSNASYGHDAFGVKPQRYDCLCLSDHTLFNLSLCVMRRKRYIPRSKLTRMRKLTESQDTETIRCQFAR